MKISHLFFFLIYVCPISLFAQITIGSAQSPMSGALLDLKQEGETTKGLIFPRVSLQNLNELTMGTNIIEDDQDAWINHTGLIVYNVNKIETAVNRICPGVHIWNGKSWISINSYPNILSQRIRGSLIRNFYYLESDPSNPNFNIKAWPSDKQADALAGKYKLGHSATNNTDNFVDTRGTETYTYNTSRFYVGYKLQDVTYLEQKSYSCNIQDTVWVTENTTLDHDSIFSDGVWMTQNLSTQKFPDGTDIPITNNPPHDAITPYGCNAGSNESNVPVYGRVYNWPAVINEGTGPGQTSNVPGNLDQGGNNEDVFMQGICPQGWHVSNAQEWVDLFNGVILNLAEFSTLSSGSDEMFKYTDTNVYRNLDLGKALTATLASKKADEGGFYALYSGQGRAVGFETMAYFWSSSSALGAYGKKNAYGYILNGKTSLVGVVNNNNRPFLFSVRCMRNTL